MASMASVRAGCDSALCNVFRANDQEHLYSPRLKEIQAKGARLALSGNSARDRSRPLLDAVLDRYTRTCVVGGVRGR